MKATATAIIALAFAPATTAFAPSSRVSVSRTASTKIFAEEEKKTEKTELVLDTNFDEVNVVKLLGLKKVRKIIRKNKSKAEGGD